MKRKKEKRKENVFSLIPNELIFEIMLFINRVDLLNFILTKKKLVEIFEHNKFQDLDTIRLYYLNGFNTLGINKTNFGGRKSIEFDKFDRIFSLFKNRHLRKFDVFEKGKVKVKTGKEFNETLFEKCGGEVNTILLEEIFKCNADVSKYVDDEVFFEKEEKNYPLFVVAGGFLTSILVDNYKNRYSHTNRQDIDVFIVRYGRNEDRVNQIFHKYFQRVKSRVLISNQKYAIVKNSNTLNVFTEKSKIPFQFVLRYINCIEELLTFFDLDSCRFGTVDGENVLTTYEGLRSLYFGKNVNIPQDRFKRLYYSRSLKYYERGFETMYVHIHPFHHLYSLEKIGEFLNVGELLNIVSSTYTLTYHNVSICRFYDSEYAERKFIVEDEEFPIYVDIGLYSSFTVNVDYKMLKEYLTVGMEEFIKVRTDFDAIAYENNNYELVLRERFGLAETLTKDSHFVCDSFESLLSSDLSVKEHGYFNTHLCFKYDIVRCFNCGCYEKKYFDNVKKSDFSDIDDEEKHVYKHVTNIENLKKLPENLYFCKLCYSKFSCMQRSITQVKQLNLQMNCLIISGRNDIGYNVALLLLRSLYKNVIVTTRFYSNLIKKFKKEKDYEEFKSRLWIYQLNLKNTDRINEFVQFVREKYRRIHVFVNCAFANSGSGKTCTESINHYQKLINEEFKQQSDENMGLFRDKFSNYMFSENNSKMAFNLWNMKSPLSREYESCLNLIDEKHASNEHLFNEQREAESVFVNSIAPKMLIEKFYDLLKPKSIGNPNFIINVCRSNNLAMAKYMKDVATKFSNYGIIFNCVCVDGYLKSDQWIEKDIPPFSGKDISFIICGILKQKVRSFGKLHKSFDFLKFLCE